jgi:ribonuclease P protein component
MLHLIAPKKDFRLAVSRNRIRRRVRAALDQIRPNWRAKLEGKVFVTPEMLALPLPELKAKIVFLLKRARIV